MTTDKSIYIFGPLIAGSSITYGRWVVTKLPDGSFTEESTIAPTESINFGHHNYAIYVRWWVDLIKAPIPLVHITKCSRRARLWLEKGEVK